MIEEKKAVYENLALNKPTAQSSVYKPEIYGHNPHGACNGKKTGQFGFHTLKEDKPWWQIDLQAICDISEIRIYNRLNLENRAKTLSILLSQDALNWELCYSNPKNKLFGGVDGNPLIVNIARKVARFVRLQLQEKDYLHLDEVEIYGIAVTSHNLSVKSDQNETDLQKNFYSQTKFSQMRYVTQNDIMNTLKKLRVCDTNLKKVRIGNNGDGGYVLPNDLSNIQGVISIGIGREVSFDKYFADLGIKVFQYDHTVKNPPIDHKNFIFNQMGWGAENVDLFMTLSKMIENNNLKNGDLLLKFDVENAEWDALLGVQPDLLKRFRIITCELHNFDKLEDITFFNKVNQVISLLTLNHTVVHIHPNNCCGVALVAGITLPRLIEFSFLRNDRASFYPSNESIPSELDYPNVASRPEIILTPFHMSIKNNNNDKNVNLALNKPTAQSSIYGYETYGYDPYGACNGLKTGKFGFSTLKEDQPWWQIDLQDIYQVSEIRIFNRIDCKERASSLNVLFSNDALNWELHYSNDDSNIFGGIDGNPLIIVNHTEKVARYIRLQLRNNEYFHLDEVEVYGTLIKFYNLSLGNDENETKLSYNFFHGSATPPPPKQIPKELLVDFTINNSIPVINCYYNNTLSTPVNITIQDYENAFNQLQNSSFQYYGNTLDNLLDAVDKYILLNKSVLIFGLVGVNCDAISLWKGAKEVYVIDYNLPISEHPKVKILSYTDYIKNNIKADIGISISSFEHDGLGRYGDPINPNGDLEAMKLAKNLIKKDGTLLLSIPVGKDCIVWNAHRIYGRIRLPMIFANWDLIDSFGYSESLIDDQDLGKYEQPIFVLKNK